MFLETAVISSLLHCVTIFHFVVANRVLFLYIFYIMTHCAVFLTEIIRYALRNMDSFHGTLSPDLHSPYSFSVAPDVRE